MNATPSNAPLQLKSYRDLSLHQKEQLRQLWNDEYPQSLYHAQPEDFENYLAGLAEARHLVWEDPEGNIRGWYTDFQREGEKWFAMILSRHIQRQGYGSRMVAKVQAEGHPINGWVIDREGMLKSDGSPYPSPLSFYLRNGFESLPGIRLEIPVLSAVKIRWPKGG